MNYTHMRRKQRKLSTENVSNPIAPTVIALNVSDVRRNEQKLVRIIGAWQFSTCQRKALEW